jgi:glyoxylase-like metal-dependent hydrolase (beta-lactamase superfamily II)
LAVLAAVPASAQRDFSKVEIKTTKLSDTVYMLEGAGGNIGVSAGEDTVFMVDDQYAPLTPKITEAVAKITPKPVQFVLNTHWHGDHTGGNESMGKTGAVIVAHENVRRRMSAEQFDAFWKTNTAASPKAALPIVTFTLSMSFHVNGEEIRVLHVGHAHTDGDAIVHFPKSDVVHMGDVAWNGIYPFIDYSTGGSVTGTIAACDFVLQEMTTEKTRIIPGHGPLASRADLQAYRDMLATVSLRVRRALADGKSDEEIGKMELSKEFDAKWGVRFLKGEQFVTMLAAGIRQTGN